MAMKLPQLTSSGPSFNDTRPHDAAPRASSAITAAAAEALAAAALCAAEAEYCPVATGSASDGSGRGIGGQSRFLDTRREKNRLAAKRCRDRKQAHLVTLESELAKQQEANEELSRHVVKLVGLYQQERKYKAAARALLHALAGALHISGGGGAAESCGLTALQTPAEPNTVAEAPRWRTPLCSTPLSAVPLLGNGSRSLSDVLGELEAGQLSSEEVELVVSELRSLTLQVLPLNPPDQPHAGDAEGLHSDNMS